MTDTPSFRPADPLGLQRVVRQPGEAGPVLLPQQAERLDPSLPLAQDELLIEVESLYLDATQTEKQFLELVKKHGKHPDLGGMLVGRVAQLGPHFPISEKPVKVGDRIATLISLSLTPLEIRKIKKIDNERVDAEGHAILFASGVLCLYEAKKKDGVRTIAVENSADKAAELAKLPFIDEVVQVDARDSSAVMEKIWNSTKGRLADVVIDVAGAPGTEMSCVLSAKPKGVVCFFGLETNFVRAALGAEGIGADVDLRIGSGYVVGHAEHALELLRESPDLRKHFEESSR